MSIPPDSLWRGCAANFPQPVSEQDDLDAQFFLATVYDYNCRYANPRLADIVYRSSSGEEDILRPVFRWDHTPIEEVFQNGFRARRQEDTPEEVYFNLNHSVHQGGMPLDSRRPTTHAFISTTLCRGWCPPVNENVEEVYRYEIYAPGGIWVAQTLGDHYRHRAQHEVSFVAGIAPQYIYSAQRFRILCGAIPGIHRTPQRLDDQLMQNRHFSPQSHPYRQLTTRMPVRYYMANGRRRSLNIVRVPETPERDKRSADNSDTTTDWYAGDVADCESYIDAGFRSSCLDEAYLFMNDEYVLMNYAPGSTKDKVLNGPLLICDGFPSLAGTAFAEHGIDSAFGSHDWNEAFIFSSNLCACIDFAPGTTNDKIIKGPMTISSMFPFFKSTVFSTGIDAAFEATTKYEAYLFKGNQYALINYGSGSACLIHLQLITDGFHGLRNTIFASGIEAAFASHGTNEAYLFKGDAYALVNFAPGTTNDYIIGGPKNILHNWPSLQPILPRKNGGLDVHNHTRPGVDDDDRDQDHDEL